MAETSVEYTPSNLYPKGPAELSDSIRYALDQEISRLPGGRVSEHDTRYPVDARGMRAFLEVFFARHLFQVQNSIMDYVDSPDFDEIIGSGRLRILDIGSGPAVASQAVTDVIHRKIDSADGDAPPRRAVFHVSHVLNDTSSICLTVGKRMLTAYSSDSDHLCPITFNHRVLTLSTAFPGNANQLLQLASYLGGFDLAVLSYVIHPLVDDNGLQNLVTGVRMLERLCRSSGRVLIVQDKFQEALVRRLAGMLGVACRLNEVTQEIYPPRGNNETGTYTYYDCFYAPRMRDMGGQRSTV
jgi:hypothetical protein